MQEGGEEERGDPPEGNAGRRGGVLSPRHCSPDACGPVGSHTGHFKRLYDIIRPAYEEATKNGAPSVHTQLGPFRMNKVARTVLTSHRLPPRVQLEYDMVQGRVPNPEDIVGDPLWGRLGPSGGGGEGCPVHTRHDRLGVFARVLVPCVFACSPAGCLVVGH